ncbi:hypothetical protein GCM10011518_41850 [Flavobacterium limi]|uniref:Response regulatory domain-containing protein n=2 Tax=Flavobacterium limi TaxID=2045105 RepID=A0ABQ1UWV6_9FLAO|nr:hypothetical protein GCM10011518_41850 [Flavobacterium limi]
MDAIAELDLPFTVKQACDGKELLESLNHNRLEIPEIVFLDINMPGIGGFECLKEIRDAKDRLNRLRIIMLSTSGTRENIRRSFELGADLYAVKPSSFAGLKDMLYEILASDLKAVQKSSSKVYSVLNWLM